MKKSPLYYSIAAVLVMLGIQPLLHSGTDARLSGRVFEEQQKLFAADGATMDFMGYSAAISGDTALVGAPNDDIFSSSDQGSVRVFVRDGDVWTQQAQLIADDGANLDFFGISVALDGDTALVGAYNHDVGGNEGQGAAYVFVRSGTTWTQQQKLTVDDGETFDSLGYSVALDGDTALVGAYGVNVEANNDQGAAYVFVRSGTTWTQQAQLIADDGAAIDNLGSSAALNGDTALVGAFNADIGANSDQGAVYVFARNGTTWTQQQKLTSSDGATNDLFGYNAVLDGDTAVFGVPSGDVNSNEDQGAAYVFVWNGTTWTQQQKLIASDGTQTDSFGYSVAISANRILAAAYNDDVGSNENQGSVHVYAWNGANWAFEEQLTATDGAAGDFFGSSLAMEGDTALIAAFGAENEAVVNAGAAYVLVNPDPVVTNTPGGSTETPTNTPEAPTETPTPTNQPGTTDLVENGGFEGTDVTPWTVKNGSGDKIKCNKDKDGDGIPDKIVAHAGNCAFQFKNVVGEAGKLEQNVDLSAIVPGVGDGLDLSFFAQSKGGATVKAKVMFKYADDSKTKISVESSGAEVYTEFTGSETLTSADVTKAKISFKSAQTSGKVYVDDVSLLHTVTSDLIAVPEAKLSSSTR